MVPWQEESFVFSLKICTRNNSDDKKWSEVMGHDFMIWGTSISKNVPRQEPT
jgi:hypothetical protein